MKNRKADTIAKIALVVGLAIAAMIVAIAMSAKAERRDVGIVPYETEQYIVCAGDTLWDIADGYAAGDKRQWIYEVCRINGISADRLGVGMVLKLPKRAEESI